MLERIAQVSGEVRQLAADHGTEAALERIASAYREQTGTDGHVLHYLPSEQLLALLSTRGELDTARSLYLAELLTLEADLVGDRDATDPQVAKALDLYLEAISGDRELIDEYAARVEKLIERLEDLELAVLTERRIFEFYLARGAYAAAEDRLFSLLDRVGPDPELVARGRRFYLELQALPDSELSRGGLPASEVEEGLRALEKLANE